MAGQRNKNVSLKEFGSETVSIKFSNGFYNVLFNNFNAVFSIEKDVEMVVNWQDDFKNRIYLGTYFPKTVAETFSFFTYFFASHKPQEFFKENKLTILDLGSNSFPATVGFLFALKNNNFITKFKEIKIYSVDLNEGAFNLGKNVLTKLFPGINFNFVFKRNNLSELVNREVENRKIFDIVLCSKVVNELIRKDVNFAFLKTIRFAEKILKNDGIFYLSDITSPINGNVFLPFIMNQEIADYLREDNKLDIVFPIPCSYWGKNCKAKNCFTQVVVEFNNPKSPRQKQIAKFSPKLFLKKEKGKQIKSLYNDIDNEFVIAYINESGLRKYCSLISK